MKKLDALLDEKELLSTEDYPTPAEENGEEKSEVLSPDTAEKVANTTEKTGHVLYYILAITSAVVLIGTLLYCVTFLPRIGSTDGNRTVNEIETEYLENGIEKTGATNFVTGMILDYRAFDTLGESFVLFTAVTCVLILLEGFKSKHKREDEAYQPLRDPLLRTGCSFLVPVILLFGAYVILNGSISPGGGFSGGAIMGAGLIVYAIAFGFEESGRFFSKKTFRGVSAFALLTYCGSKTYSFLTGAMEAESVVPLGIPGTIVSGGIIFILNVCVGLVVTSTMFGFYSLFEKGDI